MKEHSSGTSAVSMVEIFADGMSWRKVAGELGIALSTLQRMKKVAA